jgi:hypothetical protein
LAAFVQPTGTQVWLTHVWPLQSALLLQPTQVPAPSQTLPPLSSQTVPRFAFPFAHVFALQSGVRHLVAGAGQSLGTLHATHLPAWEPEGSPQTMPLPHDPALACCSGVGPLQAPV